MPSWTWCVRATPFAPLSEELCFYRLLYVVPRLRASQAWWA